MALKNSVRDVNITSDTLKDNLYVLGDFVGKAIIEQFFIEERTIKTSLGETVKGECISSKAVAVISTKDDYRYFGEGVSKVFPNVVRGYIDFAGERGKAALTCPLREITLPDKEDVEAVIVAKSVLATGCTAITLAKRAVEKYNPKYLIVASTFYSEQGIEDLEKSCRHVEIFTIGNCDELREDGMLTPGIGNLDERLNKKVDK